MANLSQNVATVSHVAKSFDGTPAVVDVSFEVEQGEILGLLGPNGAGKTTTIRMMLDLFKPDHGTCSVLGGPMTEEKKDRIGYLPEERGLYQDIPLERCLLYMASLKGIAAPEARRRLGDHLERFGLAAHKDKKVKELSKGMQQQAQLISATLHRPELIIIDEPFAGLDPVNTRLVQSVMRDLREQGAAILMSTHQMHQVEELCDRILLIDHGRDVLYGDLEGIRKSYAGHAVVVHAPDELPMVPGVERISSRNGATLLTLAERTRPHEILQALVAHGVMLDRFEVAVPTLDEIFIRVVKGGV
jgi:ABC-2 type transport system ATP-binding protein